MSKLILELNKGISVVEKQAESMYSTLAQVKEMASKKDEQAHKVGMIVTACLNRSLALAQDMVEDEDNYLGSKETVTVDDLSQYYLNKQKEKYNAGGTVSGEGNKETE